ncbi:MAG: hypothetical protein ACK4FE_00785 [Azonexus sp.]
MVGLLRKALTTIPAGNLWLNPQYGLKTRGSQEDVRPLCQEDDNHYI